MEERSSARRRVGLLPRTPMSVSIKLRQFDDLPEEVRRVSVNHSTAADMLVAILAHIRYPPLRSQPLPSSRQPTFLPSAFSTASLLRRPMARHLSLFRFFQGSPRSMPSPPDLHTRRRTSYRAFMGTSTDEEFRGLRGIWNVGRTICSRGGEAVCFGAH